MNPTTEDMLRLIRQLQLANNALRVMTDFFYPEDLKKIGMDERPDDKKWFYLSKKTADEFKREYLKYLLR